MQQWVGRGARRSGLSVNYTPTGSPDGLTPYSGRPDRLRRHRGRVLVAAAAAATPSRGYQYVPDVAGAVAVMYNVKDRAGRKVDYLHLSRVDHRQDLHGRHHQLERPGRSPPTTTGLKLPDQPINVVYRGGQSGTTALFYDFVQHIDAGHLRPVGGTQPAARPTCASSSSTARRASRPRPRRFNGSDQIAQYVASDAGKWIDRLRRVRLRQDLRRAPRRGCRTQSGELGAAVRREHLGRARVGATLRPDLSQELSGVYASGNPLAYPISAYSYIVTQCAAAGDRPTCKGHYSNAGRGRDAHQVDALHRLRRARSAWPSIGYSPLPPNLSQEIANSIGRMNGTPAEKLTPATAPTRGSTAAWASGPESPPDPYLTLTGGGGAGGNGGPGGANGGAGGNGSNGSDTNGSGGSGDESANGSTDGSTDGSGSADEAAAGRAGGAKSAGGGSTSWKQAHPVAYANQAAPATAWPVIALLLALAVPVTAASVGRRRGRLAATSSPPVAPWRPRRRRHHHHRHHVRRPGRQV